MEENIDALLKLIPSNEKDKRFILAVDGLSRSGKTTLVKKLSQNLKERDIPFHVFHLDDHIVERDKRYNTEQEEWFEYYHLQWDVNWLSLNFFDKLRHSNQLALPFYNHESDSHNIQEITLPNECVIVIEGIFLQRKEWKNFYDFIVYLDCPRIKRFQRESEHTQKNIKKFNNRYWKAEDFYLKTAAPKKNADLVLKG